MSTASGRLSADPAMRAIATRLVERLRQAGHQALLAGGCVRDTLLGREPHDFDIATSALPEEIQALFPRTIPVGAAFGVIIVLEQGHEFQVATFRSDGPYRDGRHPESVSFTTAEGDAARRDFTINGLFQDPLDDSIIDFVGGRNDLVSRTIRCIGDPASRFAEDHLRLIRAIRFAATLDFSIDPATWDALVAAAPSILTVSAERLRDELVKILTHPSRLAGFDLLDRSTLLSHIIPEMETLKGCEQPPDFHPEGDVFVHTRLMLSLLGPVTSTPLVLSVLLHDIAKPPCRHLDETGRIRFSGHESLGAEMAERIMERLRFPNSDTAAVVDAVRNHMSFKDVKNMRTSTLKRFLARPTMDDELELHRVDCLASHGMLDNHSFLLAKREEFSNEPLIPPPLVTGRDLIALGAKPGPDFKKTLTTAQSLQLEGALTTREEALEWIASHHPAPTPNQ